MLFLSETRLFGRKAANLRKMLGFDGVMYVDCVAEVVVSCYSRGTLGKSVYKAHHIPILM